MAFSFKICEVITYLFICFFCINLKSMSLLNALFAKHNDVNLPGTGFCKLNFSAAKNW